MPKTKVLIVDDEPTIRWAVTELLQGWGYATREASTVAAARAAMAEWQPTVMLLDLNLPDGSGLDFLSDIKHSHTGPAVIMITAELPRENAVTAWRKGAADFLRKPIRADELHAALKRAVPSQLQPTAAAGKPRLLIVADSAAGAQSLSIAFNASQADISKATTLAELDKVLRHEHDLALVDVAPAELKRVLQTLRMSASHTHIPVLVRQGRIAAESSLAGVLPKHRAMPCSDMEILTLTQRRSTSSASQWRARQVL